MGRTEKKPRARAWHITIALAALTASANAPAAPPSQDSQSVTAVATDTDAGEAQNADTSRRDLRNGAVIWGNLGDTGLPTPTRATANLSIYTYVRYLNQMGTDSTYKDAFGNVTSLQERQEIQLLKVQIKFLGWILNEKFRYFVYAWSSNATQGQGAQVVLAGNLNYIFNDYFTL